MKKSIFTTSCSLVLSFLVLIPQISTASAQSDTAESTSSQIVQKLSENNAKDNHTSVEIKKDDKPTSKNTKTSAKSSFPNINGIKNIVDHPFRIIGRGLGWGMIGTVLGIIGTMFGVVMPFAYLVATLALVCGLASKTIQLYLEGCK